MMASAYNALMKSSPAPIVDSAWFWACLFASVGLVALWAMGPKYAGRQLLEERKAQGRMRAAEQAAEGEMTTEVSSEGNLEIRLTPLYGILSGLLMVAWAVLWWTHMRPQAKEATAESEDELSVTKAQP